MHGKAFTGLQMCSLQGGDLLFHYSAGIALLAWLPQVCCHPASGEPALLLCVKQEQELLWAPRTHISPLTFPIHCTELQSLGQKQGGRIQLR